MRLHHDFVDVIMFDWRVTAWFDPSRSFAIESIPGVFFVDFGTLRVNLLKKAM